MRQQQALVFGCLSLFESDILPTRAVLSGLDVEKDRVFTVALQQSADIIEGRGISICLHLSGEGFRDEFDLEHALAGKLADPEADPVSLAVLEAKNAAVMRRAGVFRILVPITIVP
jgi:hypothetical protein